MTVDGAAARSRRTVGRAALACVAAILITTFGCGGPRPCVVSGTVLVDNVPAGGIYVIFHTASDAAKGLPDSGSTRTGDDGAFSVVVSGPGETVVTAFWPTVTVKGQDIFEGADKFEGVHRDASRPVAKLTVQEGDNTLPPILLARPAAKKAPPRGRR